MEKRASPFITPTLVASGWDVNEQVFYEFTLKAGRMVVRGERAAELAAPLVERR